MLPTAKFHLQNNIALDEKSIYSDPIKDFRRTLQSAGKQQHSFPLAVK
jgi:hypothetical protein